MSRTYECAPEGEEPHRFTLYIKSGEHPRFCTVCGAEIEGEVVPVPAKMSIGGSAIGRSMDETYRLLETSSAARAAELNAPALKVTDMKDTPREGDVAAKTLPVSAEFAHFNQERRSLGLPPMTGWGGGFAAGGARMAPRIPGPSPRETFAGPGHIALAGIQPAHDARVHEIIANPTHKPYVRGR